jgi:two-component system, NarL family, sensor histidine kinase DesK
VADIERAARETLSEVREAVSGYRRTTLAAELAGARIALDAAGIRCTADRLEPSGLPSGVEDVLGWTVREGTTNVLRHSQASHCTIGFQRDDRRVAVEILDDGRGQDGPPQTGDGGAGLAGLAERVAARGGRLEAGPRPRGGFRLRVELPVELPAQPVAEGASPLSEREREVLAAAAGGATVADIAARLYLSEGTVRNHLSAAIRKTGARNRAEAGRIAEEKGWL